jgi:hypothetical protein
MRRHEAKEAIRVLEEDIAANFRFCKKKQESEAFYLSFLVVGSIFVSVRPFSAIEIPK